LKEWFVVHETTPPIDISYEQLFFNIDAITFVFKDQQFVCAGAPEPPEF
jgi:hypothetical protein